LYAQRTPLAAPATAGKPAIEARRAAEPLRAQQWRGGDEELVIVATQQEGERTT
jgi:hypothetical protein